MDVLTNLADGFSVALLPRNLLLAFLGALVGTMIGVLPGIGPITGVAILFPLTFSLELEPASALILLAGIYYGAMYGGSTTSILLNVPGEASSVVTTLDGYQMARQGRAKPALAVAAIGSFVAGTVSIIGLMAFGPLLSRLAIEFGPAEYFVLLVAALSLISSLAGKNVFKALIAGVFGLMLATIGVDPGSGVPRYTFGQLKLMDGVDFLVVAIGLFAVSEVLILLEQSRVGAALVPTGRRAWITMRELAFSAGAMVRGSLLGFVIGTLPGAGASISSFVSYTLERRLSDRDQTFGKGDIRGVAAPESANNAAAGGALIPLLTLGVPGSGTTAVLLGALISMNITPGPLLFENHPDVVWPLIASMYIGNVMLLVLNLPLVFLFVKILTVPRWILMPAVVVISYIGVYAVNNSPFDILVMTAFGAIGYVMRKLDFPLAPVILGLVLGVLMETNLRRALIVSDGSMSIFFASPLTKFLWVVVLGVLVGPVALSRVRKARQQVVDAEAEL
jgi:putative tricarboxylic transport membrane protein